MGRYALNGIVAPDQYTMRPTPHTIVYRGSVPTFADLPSINRLGDGWMVLSPGAYYAWIGSWQEVTTTTYMVVVPPSTIDNVSINRIRLEVTNQAIYWQSKIPIGTSGHWDTIEHHMLPGSRIITERMQGIRVRAGVLSANLPAGVNPAVFSLDVITP